VTLKMRFTQNGATKDLEFPPERTEEILQRCADKFCAKLTAEDLVRFADIQRRYGK
jgi:hypothetical protein